MRILITNDDGIWAEGIKALCRELEKVGEVTVVAPEKQQSASGHGITTHKPLRAQLVKFRESKAKGFAVNGTPSDCVKLAIEALMPEPPHLVVSGINFGPNLGTDILYSGTVSGALEGAINGVPSFAVSLATHEDPDFTYAARFAAHLAQVLQGRKLPGEILLNVNVPPLPAGEIKGVQVTRLGRRKYVNIFERRVDPRGREYFWLGGDALDIDNEPGTDIHAVQNGYISITPIHFNLTSFESIKVIEEWKINLPRDW